MIRAELRGTYFILWVCLQKVTTGYISAHIIRRHTELCTIRGGCCGRGCIHTGSLQHVESDMGCRRELQPSFQRLCRGLGLKSARRWLLSAVRTSVCPSKLAESETQTEKQNTTCSVVSQRHKKDRESFAECLPADAAFPCPVCALRSWTDLGRHWARETLSPWPANGSTVILLFFCMSRNGRSVHTCVFPCAFVFQIMPQQQVVHLEEAQLSAPTCTYVCCVCV